MKKYFLSGAIIAIVLTLPWFIFFKDRTLDGNSEKSTSGNRKAKVETAHSTAWKPGISGTAAVASDTDGRNGAAGPPDAFLEKLIYPLSIINIFSLSSNEQKLLLSIVDQFRPQIHALARQSRKVVRSDADRTEIVITGYRKEGTRIKTEFEKAVTSALGEQRGTSYLKASRRNLDAVFLGFGQEDVRLTVTFAADGRPVLEAVLPISTVSYSDFDQIPSIYQSVVKVE